MGKPSSLLLLHPENTAKTLHLSARWREIETVLVTDLEEGNTVPQCPGFRPRALPLSSASGVGL